MKNISNCSDREFAFVLGLIFFFAGIFGIVNNAPWFYADILLIVVGALMVYKNK